MLSKIEILYSVSYCVVLVIHLLLFKITGHLNSSLGTMHQKWLI